MHGRDPPSPPDRRPDETDETLRAKYLDYCSAQLADLLLFLSPDEIFLVAQRAAREQGRDTDVSYTGMVEVATDWLSARVVLPPFEVWADDYRAHPELYEAYLMGLWESESDAAG